MEEMTLDDRVRKILGDLRYIAPEDESTQGAKILGQLAAAVRQERERCKRAALTAYTSQAIRPHDSDIVAFLELMGEELHVEGNGDGSLPSEARELDRTAEQPGGGAPFTGKAT